METIQKILVAIDFSDHSARVLRLAAELCRKHEAAATLLHVRAPLLTTSSHQLQVPSSSPNELGQLTLAMDTAKRELRANGVLQVDAKLLQGRPDGEIVRLARAGGFGLIVMGTHGRTGLSHVMLGSTAERVVRRAPCPVMTVHLESGHRKANQISKEVLQP